MNYFNEVKNYFVNMSYNRCIFLKFAKKVTPFFLICYLFLIIYILFNIKYNISVSDIIPISESNSYSHVLTKQENLENQQKNIELRFDNLKREVDSLVDSNKRNADLIKDINAKIELLEK